MIFGLKYGTDALSYLIYIVFSLIAVYIAIIFHEVAHGLVAHWCGDDTAKNMGRLSLNPLKHFDMVGFAMMLIMGFGYAKPVPVNPNNFKHYKRGMFAVAIAGIVANIILAILSALFFDLMCYGYLNAESGGAKTAFLYLADFFELLGMINLSLAFFNILPIYPLDGFRIVETFTGPYTKFSSFMRTNGQFIIFGLVGLSFIVSMAFNYANLPSWFRYIDILGTYLSYARTYVFWAFRAFWALMIPGV